MQKNRHEPLIIGRVGGSIDERCSILQFIAHAATGVMQMSMEVILFMLPIAGPHRVVIPLGGYLPGIISAARIEA